MSDVEDETDDANSHPVNIGARPYRFEPERLDENIRLSPGSDGQDLINDDWFSAVFLFFFFFL